MTDSPTQSSPAPVVSGLSIYIRAKHGGGADMSVVRRDADALAQRLKRVGLSWVAIGAVWQQGPKNSRSGPIVSRFMNQPAHCAVYRAAFRAVGIVPYVWGYPWLGGEQWFINGMADCAGDDALHLLDPELGMNPNRNAADMSAPNESAHTIVSMLRGAHGAKKIGLSTFGGVPSWFPLRAFLVAGVDFAGGQTYTDDSTVERSAHTFVAAEAAAHSTAQIVPNYGLYKSVASADGTTSTPPKTPDELRTHLDVVAGEGCSAAIGWADNFLTPELEPVLAEYAPRFV